MQSGDELTVIFKSAFRGLQIHALGQQALHSCAKFGVAIEALVKSGLPDLRLGVVGRYAVSLMGIVRALTVALVHRWNRTGSFALAVRGYTTEIQNGAQ